MAFFYVAIAISVLLLFPVFARADAYFDLSRRLFAVDISMYGISVARINVFDNGDGLVYSVNGNGEKRAKTGNGGGFPFFKAVKIRKLKIVMRLGLTDAAQTALCTAVINNAKIKNTEVTCVPNFNNKTSLSASVNIYTMPVLGVIYGFRKVKTIV